MSDSRFVRPVRPGEGDGGPRAGTAGPGPYAGSGARRVRRRAGLLGLGLLLVPVLEIAVAVAVGRMIGVTATVLLVLAGCVAGVLILRRLGAGAVRRLATPGGLVETPARPAGETGVMVLAGLLLAFPGLVTDVVGLLLLVPPVRRALVRRTGSALAARIQRLDMRGMRVVQGQIITGGAPGADGSGVDGSTDRVDVKVIQVRDVDPPTAR